MIGREISSDFLHNIPANVDRDLNLTNRILTCADTTSTDERLAVYEQLLEILNKMT